MPPHSRPEFERFRRYAPLPVAWVAASGAAVAGVGGGTLAIGLAVVSALALAGGGLVWLDARASLRSAQARRAAGSFRFLCPSCLCFGPFTYGCGQCGDEVEAFVVHTGGLYFNDCNRCKGSVFPRPGSDEKHQLQARCIQCGHGCDLRHHERAIRVLATLHGRDFDTVCRTEPAGKLFPGPPRHFCRDDGATVTCLLDLRMPQPEMEHLPNGHAAGRVDGVWLDPARFFPLEFGRVLDSLLRQIGQGKGKRSRVPLYLARDVEDPVLNRLLEQRFRHWETLPDPAAFFQRGGAGRHRPSSLASPAAEDLLTSGPIG